jgi:uncharacterized protein (TIGR00645 family)
MKRLELFVEQIILASRWLLVVFYLGLAVALGVYAVTFGGKLMSFVSKSLAMDEADAILSMLSLIDAALVASLVVMVIIAGYENFVSKFDENSEVHWLGTIDAGSLKIKVASTIVAISSIDLLQIFLDLTKYTNDKIMWATLMHLAFVFSALILAYVDRMTSHGKPAKNETAQY